MALSPRLELKASQQLTMTPQLQQAIRLLQMNSAELAEFLTEEIARNPFLEQVGEPELESVKRVHDGRIPGTTNNGLADFDLAAIDNIRQPVTLIEHMVQQIRTLDIPPELAQLAQVIAGELAEDGYLRMSLGEIADRNNASAELADRALAAVQSCVPTGVGARNLAECLRLQLLELQLFDEGMLRMIENIALVGKKAIPELMRLTGLSEGALRARLATIRKLNPKPGSQFSTQPVMTRIPDVIVSPGAGDGWHVELTGHNIPKIMVNNQYVAQISVSGASIDKTMAELSHQATWLVRMLDQRASTILKVAGAVTKIQDGFFRHGIAAIRPMTLGAVANAVGTHESTVSRATTGKYIACARGVFAFKALFSGKVASIDGNTNYSAASVIFRIGRIIAEERSGRALTDAGIVTLLRSEGIKIARRTVAKHRLALRLPRSGFRQRVKSAAEGQLQTD